MRLERELKGSIYTLLFVRGLVHGAVAGDDEALHAGAIQRDWAEALLVLGDVVGQYIQERLGLLGAQVNALEVLNADLVRRRLGSRIDGPKDQEEVPDGEPDLHAVGVGIAVIRGFFKGNAGVVGLGDGLAHAFPGIRWCGRGDLNPYALRHRLLRPACLPFHHSRDKDKRNGSRSGLQWQRSFFRGEQGRHPMVRKLFRADLFTENAGARGNLADEGVGSAGQELRPNGILVHPIQES